MHIKQIIIEGFKSYGIRTVIDPLHPGHNVVVGANGSGKSNFFAAIQFVLSNEFNRLQNEQRHALLHEGTGPRTMAASVEIIFDNSDRRLPVDKDEVSLKRVIGLKKDQYILNKSVISRNEVDSLLETAGFSKSNPYYIIQQGKVNEVAMTSESRLTLLKEIAGVQVYENRRNESLKILQETQIKIKRIEELLQTINEKLDTLNDEADELKKYQHLDKRIRAIEHVIYEGELSRSNDEMNQLKTLHADLTQEQAKLQEQVVNLSKEIKNINHDLKRTHRDADIAEEEEDNLCKERDKLLKEQESLSIRIYDLNEEIKCGEENHKLIEEKLVDVNRKIEDAQKRLNEVIPEWELAVDKGKKIIRELNSLEQEQQTIFTRQGRSTHFKTKEDRDIWINKEIKLINNQITDKQMHIANLESHITENDQKRIKLEESAKQISNTMEHHHDSVDKYHRDYLDLTKKRDDLSASKKDLCRKENALQNEIAYLEEDLKKTNQDLYSQFGKGIFNGINSVKKVLKTFSGRDDMKERMHEYYGLAIECFNCSPDVYRAVEVTGNNRLFHHIVKSSDFGREILKEMNRQNLPGVANFMPLDRLKVPNVEYPNTEFSKPLIHWLEFNKVCELPIRYIFQKVIVTRDLRIATEIAGSSGFDCVTLEGDQASSKGWLKGGHFTQSKSPMKMQEDKINLIHQLDPKRRQLEDLTTEINNIENDITSVISRLQSVETKKSKAREVYERLTYDSNNIKEQIEIIKNSQISRRKSVQELEADLVNLETLKQKLENELKEDLNAQFTSADKQQVEDLNASMVKWRMDLKTIFEKRETLEKEKIKLENLLKGHLNCKKNELEGELQAIGLEDKKLTLKELELHKKLVEGKIKKSQKDLKAIKANYQDIIEQRKLKLEKLEELHKELKPITKAFEEKSEKIQRSSSKKRMLEGNIVNIKIKTAELGIFPSGDLYSKYSKVKEKELYKKLDNYRKDLKNYKHVNKKAHEQHSNFKDQRDNLTKRKEELDRANRKIQQLMNFLQQKKYEAVEFTFKQVSKYFSEIFSKLVPRGSATLVMQKQRSSQSENDSSSNTTLDLDSVVGIGVRVSFTSQSSSMEDHHQLSGGEKSLVALALIFAIQQCDPAPFYLLDEIDRDLDTSHRQAVANMIHELSSGAQIITITHRPELLHRNSQHYGVTFQNKISRIHGMDYQQALQFLQDDPDDVDNEDDVGDAD